MPDRACAWHYCLDVRGSVLCVDEREKRNGMQASGSKQVYMQWTVSKSSPLTHYCFNHISVTKTCIKGPVRLAWREQRSLAELPWEVGSWRIVRSLLRGWARPIAAGSAEAELASSSSLRPGFIHSHLGSDLWLRLIQCVLSQKGANWDLQG